MTKTRLWSGRIIGTLIVLFLLMDCVAHALKPSQVVEAFARLGLPIDLAMTLAIVEFLCIVLYVIPRTNVLGAILLTGYLGGAISINLRAGSPLFECVFPLLMGILVWAPPYLLDERLRGIFPLRR